MKKNVILLKSMFAVLAMFLITGLTACKNENKPEDTKEVAEDQNEAKFDENDAKEDDSEFLVAAAESDMMEIELGKLAQSKGMSADVKNFGKMMVDEHTKSANETKPFADRLQVSLPAGLTDKGKEQYNELNEKTGKDFDEKFADLMVKNHEKAVDKMEKASTDANDPEIRSWAAGKVPVLRGHLEHAKTLQDKIKNAK